LHPGVKRPDKGNRQLEAGGEFAAGAGGVQARQAQADGPRTIGDGMLRMAIIDLDFWDRPILLTCRTR
jgi:hypothetical protein